MLSFPQLVEHVSSMDAEAIQLARVDFPDLMAEVTAHGFVKSIGVDSLADIKAGRRPMVHIVQGKLSTKDTLIANEPLLHAVVKVYPDRIPSKLWCAAVCLNVSKLTVPHVYPGGDANQLAMGVQDSVC